VTLPRVLAVVAEYGDRRCRDGGTAKRRQELARMYCAELRTRYYGNGYASLDHLVRGHGLPAYPSVQPGKWLVAQVGVGRGRMALGKYAAMEFAQCREMGRPLRTPSEYEAMGRQFGG